MKRILTIIALICAGTLQAQQTPEEILDIKKSERLDNKAAITFETAAQTEIQLAGVINANPDIVASTQEAIAREIWTWYRMANLNVGVRLGWEHEKLPLYIPNFSTNTSRVTRDYYVYSVLYQASLHFAPAIRAVKTREEFNSVITEWLGSNLLPPRVAEQNDSRFYVLKNFGYVAIEKAVSLNMPGAINWAVLGYRMAENDRQIDRSVAQIARALKAKDLTLTRANAFIDAQNSGGDIPLDVDEVAPPAAIVPLVPHSNSIAHLVTVAEFDAALDIAIREYRSAKSAKSVELAVNKIAHVLRAYDLHLGRANAFIDAQQSGAAFDLELSSQDNQ